MLTVSCLCGAVRVAIAKQPDFINECNCALCSGSGAQWAYFHPSDVIAGGVTTGYSRADKAEPGSEIRFCPTCGATTHFVLTPGMISRHGNSVMGVNMRLAGEAALAGIELRYPDGRAWPGEGPYGYVREARILGRPPQDDPAADA